MTIEEQIKHLRGEKQKPFQKEVDAVLAKKTHHERIRAAIDLWLKVNPKVQDPRVLPSTPTMIPAQAAHRLLLNEIKQDRQTANKYATNETGSMRSALRLLPEMLQFIQLFIPDLFDGSADEQREKSYKLVKALPEYSIMSKV